jgi:hypothetical protein
VIEAFGQVVIGGNYAVGIIVFHHPDDHQLSSSSPRVRGASPR